MKAEGRSLCMQIDFPGTVYITDKHTCFAASSGNVSFCIAHKTKQIVKKLLQGVGSGMLYPKWLCSCTEVMPPYQRSQLHFIFCFSELACLAILATDLPMLLMCRSLLGAADYLWGKGACCLHRVQGC